MYSLFDLPAGSGLARQPIDTLRVVPMAEPLGYFVGFNLRRDSAAGPGLGVNRQPVVVMRDQSGNQKVLYEGPDTTDQRSRLIDLAPAYSSSRAVALVKTRTLDIPSRRFVDRFSLLSIGLESTFGPFDFLDQPRGAWTDPDHPNGPPKATYDPLLCVGHLDGPGDLVVIARREVSVPDTTIDAVVALWLRGNDFSIRREIVVERNDQSLTPGTWPDRVRAWPTLGPIVGSQGGDLHVGIQTGNEVRVYRVHSNTSTSPSPVFSTRATVDADLEDFRIVGGLVDTREMNINPSGGAGGESVGCVVLQEQDGRDDSSLLVENYNNFGSIPRRRLALGTTFGQVSLLRETDTESRFLLADWGDGFDARIRRLGTQVAVYYRASLRLRPADRPSNSELAMCFHPALDHAVLATAQIDRTRRSNPWSIVGVDAHRGRAHTTLSLGTSPCPPIGLPHLGSGTAGDSPIVGHAPYAGQYFFEIRLIGGPSRANVWLVVGEIPLGLRNAEPDASPCRPTLDRLSPHHTVLQTPTDDRGNATLRVPFDDTGLPTVFTRGPDFASRGEILRYPPLIFAQWQWFRDDVRRVIVEEELIRRDWGVIDHEFTTIRIRPTTLTLTGSQTLALLIQG